MQALLSFYNSRSCYWRRLLLFIYIVLPSFANAHPSPNTLGYLDVSPGQVVLEIQVPLSELELAFGQPLTKKPATVIGQYRAQLKEYLLAHIHAYVRPDHPWQVKVSELSMMGAAYPTSNINYWELKAVLTLTPQSNEDTRHFYLDYDAVIHQVVNHVALMTVRNDWSTGSLEKTDGSLHVISWDLAKNIIPPLEIKLEEGSRWLGFRSMFSLGMNHIKEGTDHLLFLLVLLLPATLVATNRRWGQFAGTKKSFINLLKIITAFTIGHSITLIAGALGWIQLPSQPIEILIAISILISAIHVIRPLFPGKELFIAGFFGLIHGMAFATTLTALHLDRSTLSLSILGFNLGIECMQVVIMFFILPWLVLMSMSNAYRWVRPALAVLAGIAAIGWMIERMTDKANTITDTVQVIVDFGYWNYLGLVVVAISIFLLGKSSVNKSSL